MFDLREQAAVSGIPAFGRQAGIQIVAPASRLAGKRTMAVKGRMTVDAALDRLLEGTGLHVLARSAAVVSLGVRATTPTADTTPIEPVDGTDIIVTGSHIAQNARDSATPVAVVGARDIRLSGAINVENIFKDSTQFVPSTNGGAYGNVVPGGTADINLRGLGATRNLVLVNGRRFTISGRNRSPTSTPSPQRSSSGRRSSRAVLRRSMAPTRSPASSTSSCATIFRAWNWARS
jgi:hypothetical protein